MEAARRCRACGAAGLEAVLDLGLQPLANALLPGDAAGAAEPRFPLRLGFCAACSMTQLLDSVDPERLFREYVYFSSFSDTMLAHAEASAAELIAERRLGPASLVVEVASNDGYQLQYFQRAGIPVLGIEPAENVAAEAQARGIPTRTEFFGKETAERLAAQGARADLLLAFNVVAHVPDPNDFVAGIAKLLAPDGIAVIEAPHVGRLIEGLEFDTIYHEHVFYLSLSALRPLFARHGLELFRVREIPLHGGSLRCFVAASGSRPLEPSVAKLLAREAEQGLVSGAAQRRFAARVPALRERTRSLLDRLHGEGARLAAYGAAAKGATLLNYYGIGADRLAFVADRSPHKQGRLMPGVQVPIAAPEALLRTQPDYCLLLAWNLEAEILDQQRAYREAGGRFIVPIPEPRIV